MFHSVEDGKVVREDTIPSDIGALVDVHDDDETYEDPGEVEIDELAEEGAEFYHIERLAIVHEAAEDF